MNWWLIIPGVIAYYGIGLRVLALMIKTVSYPPTAFAALSAVLAWPICLLMWLVYQPIDWVIDKLER